MIIGPIACASSAGPSRSRRLVSPRDPGPSGLRTCEPLVVLGKPDLVGEGSQRLHVGQPVGERLLPAEGQAAGRPPWRRHVSCHIDWFRVPRDHVSDPREGERSLVDLNLHAV